MKRTNRFVSVLVLSMFVLSLVLPATALAKGGGGMGGGGRSFGGGSRSISGGSKGAGGISGGTKSAAPKPVSVPTKSGGSASTLSGKTTYTGKTASGQPYSVTVPESKLPFREYQAPAYSTYGGYPTRYYYPTDTGNIWFWLWLTGDNHYGTSAPNQATQVSASEVGTASAAAIGDKKVVKIQEGGEWSKYSTADKWKVVGFWAFVAVVTIAILGFGFWYFFIRY